MYQTKCINGFVFIIKLVHLCVPVNAALIPGGYHIPLANGIAPERMKNNEKRLEKGAREIVGMSGV